MRHRAALFIRQSLLPTPHLTNLNPSLLATLLHRKTTLLGGVEILTKITKTCPIKACSRPLPDLQAGMNLDLLPGHVMEEAKSGGAIMEEDKPDEDPFGWGGDLSQDHQDMSDQGLLLSPVRPNDPADAYPNLLPDCGMEDSKTSECATRAPDVLRDAVDTMVVAVEMGARTDLTLVPANTSPEPIAQNSNSRGKSRSPRRHVGEESFGLTSVHLSHQFGFRDSTLWCWRCGGWSVGSRGTSRLKGPCGAPTKNGADVCVPCIRWSPS